MWMSEDRWLAGIWQITNNNVWISFTMVALALVRTLTTCDLFSVLLIKNMASRKQMHQHNKHANKPGMQINPWTFSKRCWAWQKASWKKHILVVKWLQMAKMVQCSCSSCFKLRNEQPQDDHYLYLGPLGKFLHKRDPILESIWLLIISFAQSEGNLCTFHYTYFLSLPHFDTKLQIECVFEFILRENGYLLADKSLWLKTDIYLHILLKKKKKRLLNKNVNIKTSVKYEAFELFHLSSLHL